jgi:acid phosphatase
MVHSPKFYPSGSVNAGFRLLENYAIQNRVFSVLLGDAVPAELEGTTDDNYYNHYSEISTVEANWYVLE